MNAVKIASRKPVPHRYNPIQTIFLLCALVAALPAATQAQETTNCTQRPPGLVGWWPGDGFALDVVSTNHGTLQGASYTNGQAGRSFGFDGSSGYVAVPDSSAWAFGSSPFTIELWALFNSTSGSQAFVASNIEVPNNAPSLFYRAYRQ